MIEIKLRGGDKMILGCFYRSPTMSEKSSENNTRLNDLLRALTRKKYSHICLVGVFNYRDINWSTLSTKHSDQSKEWKFLQAIGDSFYIST